MPFSVAYPPIVISKSILAPVSSVWSYITVPDLIQIWMPEQGTELQIESDFIVGSRFLIKGKLHGSDFVNHGKVLVNDFQNTFSYSHLSSISMLPDLPENYSIIQFSLLSVHNKTELIFSAQNFASESIYRHINFYWQGTLQHLKELIEKNNSS